MTQNGHVVAIAFKAMTVEHPLIVRDFTLSPAGEWSPQYYGWTMVRIAEGLGYCLCKKSACELQAGDGFMAPQTTGVIIRASKLSALRLHYFRIQPELLYGLLTVAECQHLKTLSKSSSCISIFKADELTGQNFSRLMQQRSGEKLVLRCALLQLWANGISGLFGKSVLNISGESKLRERLFQLMEQLPEAELLGLSMNDLAQQLHCSERHLGRLFRQKFGVPFRSHQIELRLKHACQLLVGSGMKVASIAYESGYQHIGLFNATFKKHFGMTPREWLRRNLPNN